MGYYFILFLDRHWEEAMDYRLEVYNNNTKQIISDVSVEDDSQTRRPAFEPKNNSGNILYD